MNNKNIIWKWNPSIEEWELPKFPKLPIDKKKKLDIIIEEINDERQEALRRLKD